MYLCGARLFAHSRRRMPVARQLREHRRALRELVLAETVAPQRSWPHDRSRAHRPAAWLARMFPVKRSRALRVEWRDDEVAVRLVALAVRLHAAPPAVDLRDRPGP